MKVSRMSKGEVINKMFPHRCKVTYIETVETSRDDIITEYPVADNLPCSVQHLEQDESGTLRTNEYILLCPYLDLSNIPPTPKRGSGSWEVEITIQGRTYTCKGNGQVLSVGGDALYEVGGYTIGTKMHLISNSFIIW